uniref:Uncharacterized protein n=1 Tax=Caudovirales sp. ctkvU4 TaxID=2826783 RepID=A0A8S5QRA6_9CAUD|nr:MAG TPA: hypothetical protein [Caudovirales sp. ctkvU4]
MEELKETMSRIAIKHAELVERSLDQMLKANEQITKEHILMISDEIRMVAYAVTTIQKINGLNHSDSAQ